MAIPPGPVKAPALQGAAVIEEALTRPGAPLMYRVPEAVKLLRLGRSVVFEQLRSGRLHSVRQGRARLIPAWALLDYVRLLENEAAQDARG